MNITDVIKPIRLLLGSHADTAQTGSGCFMNVASYLNGDEKITDKPSCVDEAVRIMMININDSLGADDRQRLLPFVHRAMRTAGSDGAATKNRVLTMARCVSLMLMQLDGLDAETREGAKARFDMWMQSAMSSLNYSEGYVAATYIGDALMDVLMMSRISINKDAILDILLRHIDKILPPAEEPSGEVLQRAEKLVATAEQHKATA